MAVSEPSHALHIFLKNYLYPLILTNNMKARLLFFVLNRYNYGLMAYQLTLCFFDLSLDFLVLSQLHKLPYQPPFLRAQLKLAVLSLS